MGLINSALSHDMVPVPPVNTGSITDITNSSMSTGTSGNPNGIISQSTLNNLIAGGEMLIGMMASMTTVISSVFVIFGYLKELGVPMEWVTALFTMCSLAVFWGLFQMYTGRTAKTEE